MEIAWKNLEVPVETLPQLQEVAFEKHPARYQNYRRILLVLLWALPVAALSVTGSVNPGVWFLWAAIPLSILVAFSFWAVPINYRKRAYALRQRDITYRKGWIFHSDITLPFNRIQHTEVSQGPIERAFKLSTLKIYTAGGSSSDLSIPGLDDATARELREFIAAKSALDD